MCIHVNVLDIKRFLLALSTAFIENLYEEPHNINLEL